MPQKLKENLPQLVVLHTVCHHCGACVAVCPENALFLWDSRLEIISNHCSICSRCLRACPVGALILQKRFEGAG